ncbi:molybdopterin-dependent oxidoreductase [Draconibacterium orientale]|jgi:thiosulfate reductase/polysulfide reductase chain A|uniref:molybdopterin-containing oxidoreductase family protein n=1 Tax=Draconibacterium orientale TaxID=1168034 RepID=UPI002A0A6C06|nr:molybdopterin-dependent oxidoreductase [Draconibacterium orientale]
MKTRRDFIKISTAGAGAAAISFKAFGSKGFGLFESKSEGPVSDEDLTPYPTYCEVCFWKCAAWAYVDKNGTIRKVVGNKNDPHCNGRLCPRGTGGVGMVYDEDRLKTPLIRDTRKDGTQYFREASWEEALDKVANKMKEVKEKHGPEAFGLFNHGTPGGHFHHLLRAYGSESNAEPAFANCRGPRSSAYFSTFGAYVGSPECTDIRDTKCLVLIGSHLGENMHNSQVQEMSDAIDNGATIITVDPRFSTAAAHSNHWLPIKPSTDIALLMAWIHVLIYEGLYDKDYVEQYTFGLDYLKDHVKNMTPEWAYGITTIEPEEIRRTARAMADAAPSVIIHPGRHVVWYGDDTQRGRAMAILTALLGSWGKRGGLYFPEGVSVPAYPHPHFPEPKWTWKDWNAGRYPLATMGITTEALKASIPRYNYKHQLKAWLVAGTNLPLSMPDKALFKEAADSVEFIAVMDTMPMDITGYADVVLPEATYLERYDVIRSAANREPNIALRMPAIEPKYDSKPGWWISKQIGERLGLHDFFNYDDYAEVIDWQLKQLGTSLEEMKKIGVKKYPRKSGPLYLGDGEDYNFNTTTGKIELYSVDFADHGFDPIPKYTKHPEPPQNFYRLIYGRAPMHTFSRTSNNPNLSDLMSENSVWVNPKVADLWGLKNGQEVWLKNQDDAITSFPVKVRVTERIRWDSVYMVHGFGHKNKKLSRAFGKGAADTEMITNVAVDPIMGGTGMRGNFITFLTEDPALEGKEVKA